MSKSPAAKVPNTGTDWQRVAAMTDDEIEQVAAADDENPASGKNDWAEAFVGWPPPNKVPIAVRFDEDVVEWFKSQGRGYQTRMNAVLRHYMATHRKAG